LQGADHAGADHVLDREDVDARTAAARRAAADAEARMRSTAVQRCLPRPCKGDVSRASCVAASSFDHSGANFDAVHAVVAAEMRVMILNDARAHPVPGTTCMYEEVKNFTKFTESQMLQARALVEAECKLLPPVDHEAFAAAHAATQKRLMWVPVFISLIHLRATHAAVAGSCRERPRLPMPRLWPQPTLLLRASGNSIRW
jgi:molybdenum cofactor biosynthesis enzyme